MTLLLGSYAAWLCHKVALFPLTDIHCFRSRSLDRYLPTASCVVDQELVFQSKMDA